MDRLETILAVQTAAAVASVWLLRRRGRRRTRLAALAALVCLAPFLLLAALPTLLTFLGLAALPGVLVCVAALIRPAVLSSRSARGYVVACFAMALFTTGAFVAGEHQCASFTFVVPDDFAGEIRLVKDRTSGIDLRGAGWRAAIPPSGEVRARNDYPCYSTVVLSASGAPRRFRDLGITAPDMPRNPDGTSHSSTAMDGATHRWAVEPAG